MNKKFQFLLILFFPLAFFANMAQPWIEGSSHSSLYSIKNCSVAKERISVKVMKGEEGFFAHYKVTYHIISDENKEVPLVFIGRNLYSNQKVLVNNIGVEQIDIDKNSESFIQQNLNKFEIKFAENESHEIKPNELIYFKAHLKKGENIIIINYNAELYQNRFGFEKEFTLEYSLYPSKFWKSFENVEFSLEPSDEINIKSSNLGNFTQINNANVWKINSFENDVKIEFTRKYNWFVRILLFINPIGIAFIFTIIFGIFHWNFLKKRRKNHPNKYNWVIPVGILIVGILTYSIFFFSFDFIDWLIGENSKHGYYMLFIIFTMPFFFIIYGLLTWFSDRYLKKKK